MKRMASAFPEPDYFHSRNILNWSVTGLGVQKRRQHRVQSGAATEGTSHSPIAIYETGSKQKEARYYPG